MRLLGFGPVSNKLEPLARLKQVRGQIGPAEGDAETLDQAVAVDDDSAGLPEGATFARARLA